MTFAAAAIYWLIVALWLTVLITLIVFYIRNPHVFGTTRLLLAVVAIDTLRNIIENCYFGVYFGGQYGLFPAAVVGVLGRPYFLILPKVANVIAGCVVLVLLLRRWLPSAIKEHKALQQSADGLKALAVVDDLTGLYNRRHFDDLATAEWARFQRYLRPLSVIVIDIDHFLDRFDGQLGDQVLEKISAACNSVKRDGEIVARIGSDEFAILLPETSEATARTIADRLSELIRSQIFHARDEKLTLTVSIGIASANLSMSGIDALMKQAGAALYEAQRSGPNRIVSAQQLVHTANAVELR